MLSAFGAGVRLFSLPAVALAAINVLLIAAIGVFFPARGIRIGHVFGTLKLVFETANFVSSRCTTTYLTRKGQIVACRLTKFESMFL